VPRCPGNRSLVHARCFRRCDPDGYAENSEPVESQKVSCLVDICSPVEVAAAGLERRGAKAGTVQRGVIGTPRYRRPASQKATRR
jgi:hypothetical protein